MPILIRTIDQGASTPVDFPTDVSGNLITTEFQRLAEFGLKVELPQIPFGVDPTGYFNFVELQGTVGLENFNGLQTIELIVTRRNAFLFPVQPDTFDMAIDQPTFGLLENIEAQEGFITGRSNVTFNYMEGGEGDLIPPAYYAYSIWIRRVTGGPGEIPLFVDGPISFSGESQVREIV